MTGCVENRRSYYEGYVFEYSSTKRKAGESQSLTIYSKERGYVVFKDRGNGDGEFDVVSMVGLSPTDPLQKSTNLGLADKILDKIEKNW